MRPTNVVFSKSHKGAVKPAISVHIFMGDIVYIKREKELASSTVSTEDRVYLKNKISARYDRIRQFEKRRAVLTQKLMAAEEERKRGL